MASLDDPIIPRTVGIGSFNRKPEACELASRASGLRLNEERIVPSSTARSISSKNSDLKGSSSGRPFSPPSRKRTEIRAERRSIHSPAPSPGVGVVGAVLRQFSHFVISAHLLREGRIVVIRGQTEPRWLSPSANHQSMPPARAFFDRQTGIPFRF